MNLTTLNALDGLIIVTLGWNFVRGFNKGIVEEIISIAGIGLSIFLAYQLSYPTAKFLLKHPDKIQTFLIGTSIFAISFLITKYVAFSINKKVNQTSLGIINNILGFLFGIVRGILISSIIVFAVASISPNSFLIKRSSLGGIAVPVINKIIQALPLKHKKEDPFLKLSLIHI
jgi:membrane protein required for colicin V production